MEKEMIRVTKIDYIPKEIDKGAYIDPLKLIIVGVDTKGKRRVLKITGTKPRIWVTTNPEIVNIPLQLKKHITKIKKEGKSFVTGEDCWCIYFDYPYRSIVKNIRELFDYHCQSDVYYHEAVRSFYGIRAYINIPYGMNEFHISEMEALEEYKPEKDIPTNDFVLDIETDDTKGFAGADYPTGRVICLTLLNKKNKEVYHITTCKVNEEAIGKLLTDREFLDLSITHRKEVPIFEGKINVIQFNDGDPEENERNLFECLYELQNKLGITNIEEYTQFDVPYLTMRVKWMNKLIKKWNDSNNGSRKYYPKRIFDYINEFDQEKLYRRFITKSVNATGKNALEWMGNEVVGYGKIKRPDPFHIMAVELPEYLSAYNIWDCVLPDRCLDKCGNLLNLRQGQCNYMAADLSRWASQMAQWESAIMYRLKMRLLLPSISCVKRDEGMEAGGHVEGQPCGIEYNMIELDNSGEYNGVVMSCRIAHETLLKPDEDPGDRPISKLPSGRRYYLDMPAIIPDMLKEITEMIAVYKNLEKDTKNKINRLFSESRGVKTDEIEALQELLTLYGDQKYIFKSSSLSSTGLYGSGKEDQEDEGKAHRPFRLANGGFASDVTEVGRIHEKWNKNWIENHSFFWYNLDDKYRVNIVESVNISIGEKIYEAVLCNMKVIYQDTDSCKVVILGELPTGLSDYEMRDFLYLVGETYSSALNSSFDTFAKKLLGIDKHKFSIKVDGVYKKYFQWGSQKLYVWKDFNNEVHYRGVKIRRRDIMPVAKVFMEKFFEIVMADKPKSETLKEVSFLIAEYETDILAGKYNKECGEPHSVKKKTLYYQSMVHSNSIFGKKFKLGDVATFYNVTGIVGHSIPKNKKIPLEWSDDPLQFGLKINYNEVLRKIKVSMKKIINGLETGATWESVRDRHSRGSFEQADDLW
jgi:DNA polymerase elongation subunit (family B)